MNLERRSHNVYQRILVMPIRRMVLFAALTGIVLGSSVAGWIVRTSPRTVEAHSGVAEPRKRPMMLEGIVEEAELLEVHSQSSGKVAAVGVVPGMRVWQGSPIVFMENTKLKEALQSLRTSTQRSPALPRVDPENAQSDYRSALEQLNNHVKSFKDTLGQHQKALDIERDRHSVALRPLSDPDASSGELRQAQLLAETSLAAVSDPMQSIIAELRALVRAQAAPAIGVGDDATFGQRELLSTFQDLDQRRAQLRAASERLEVDHSRLELDQAMAIATTLLIDAKRSIEAIAGHNTIALEEHTRDAQAAFAGATDGLLESHLARLKTLEEDLQRSSQRLLALYQEYDRSIMEANKEDERHGQRLLELDAKRRALLSAAERTLKDDRKRLEGAALALAIAEESRAMVRDPQAPLSPGPDGAEHLDDVLRDYQALTVRSPVSGTVAGLNISLEDVLERGALVASVNPTERLGSRIRIQARDPQFRTLAVGSAVMIHPSTSDGSQGLRGAVVGSNDQGYAVEIDPWLPNGLMMPKKGDRVLVRVVPK